MTHTMAEVELTARELVIFYVLASLLAILIFIFLYKVLGHYKKLKMKYMRIFTEDERKQTFVDSSSGATRIVQQHQIQDLDTLNHHR